MIDLQHISKIYPVGKQNFYALDDVSLHIEKGEFVAICGASGSGKTTLLNIMGCLDTPSQGTYCLGGENVSRLSDEKLSHIRNAQVGFVLQDFALINDQSVLYNVMLPLLLSKAPYYTIRKRAKQALQMVGVLDQAGKKANRLSGGQRQRVAIARAIVNNPDILLADEPTGQLDSQTGRQIMALLQELNEKGITVVVVTHDEKVAACASRKIVMCDGKVIEQTAVTPHA